MKFVQPALDELLPSEDARATFEAKSAALEAAELVRAMRRRAVSTDGTIGISQEELARRIGTSQARISQIEKGDGRDGASYALLRRIAYACGVDWLLLLHAVVEGTPLRSMASSAVANMQQPFVNAPLITAPPAAFASGMALPADAMRAPTFVGGADAAVFTAGVGNETVITGGSGASAMIICGALEIGNEPPAVGYISAGNLIIGNTLVSGAGNSVMGNGLISGTGRLQRSSLATEKGGELVVEAASRSALENWSKWAATNVKAGDVATFLREAHAVSVMSETQSNNGSVTVTLSDQTKITFIGAMTAVGARLV